MLTILTGEVDSGKSSYCLRFLGEKKSEGLEVNGWLSLAHIEDGKKVGHDLYRIIHSELHQPMPFSRLTPQENSFPFGRYHLSRIAFDSLYDVPRKGIFIVDEIGALEVVRKGGFYPELKGILEATGEQLFVVQKRVFNEFVRMFPGYNHKVICTDSKC